MAGVCQCGAVAVAEIPRVTLNRAIRVAAVAAGEIHVQRCCSARWIRFCDCCRRLVAATSAVFAQAEVVDHCAVGFFQKASQGISVDIENRDAGDPAVLSSHQRMLPGNDAQFTTANTVDNVQRAGAVTVFAVCILIIVDDRVVVEKITALVSVRMPADD